MTERLTLYPPLSHPTPVLLPGESHGQRSLVGCSLWVRTESDTTETFKGVYMELGVVGDANMESCPLWGDR